MEGTEAAQSGPAADERWCHWARGQHLVLPPVLQGHLTSRQERRTARPWASQLPTDVWGSLNPIASDGVASDIPDPHPAGFVPCSPPFGQRSPSICCHLQCGNWAEKGGAVEV